MCGRFALTLPTDAMAQLFDAAPANDLPETPNYNVCPTTQIHAVHASKNGRKLVSMRWGFIPQWYKSPTDGPLLINARAETITQKPAFRAACVTQRCLIPVSGFYEWTKTATNTRLPWYIFRNDSAPLVLAGIWQDWDGGDNRLRSCAIVTTAANPAMSNIHHRMPVVLEASDWALWLGENGVGASKLMVPADAGVLRFHRVDQKVNSNKSAGPELIEEL